MNPAPDTLVCGRAAQPLLDQVADGHGGELDPHQQDCPHCQAALTEFDRLWGPVRALREESITPPESILEAALDRIRHVAGNPDFGILPGADGLTRISARVVVVLARESAQEVTGVRVALSRHRTEDETGPVVQAGAAGGSAAVQITLAADHGTDLIELGERVRRAVADRVRELTDLDVTRITVVVDDVLT